MILVELTFCFLIYTRWYIYLYCCIILLVELSAHLTLIIKALYFIIVHYNIFHLYRNFNSFKTAWPCE